MTGPDNNISAALVAFANQLQQAAEAGLAGPFSVRQSENRLQRLHQIAKEAEALAEHSESASYQAFARLLAKAEGVGATIARETIIAVGSAFISRQYVWPKLPASSSGTN